jgi:hypothetical protein
MSKLIKLTRPEYEIALEQLRRLREISEQRLLSPEEIKAYDVLVKNLRLIEDDPTVIEGYSNKPKELSTEEALDMLLPEPEKPKNLKKGKSNGKGKAKADKVRSS